MYILSFLTQKVHVNSPWFFGSVSSCDKSYVGVARNASVHSLLIL